MVNALKYVLSNSYRKHRWAARHLRIYRVFSILLQVHKVRKRPLVMSSLVEMQYQDNINKAMGMLVNIPKFSGVSKKDLLDGE